jgi:hypothetical protein
LRACKVDKTADGGEIWYEVDRIPALIWVVYDSACGVVVEGSAEAAFAFWMEDMGSGAE